MKALSLTQPWAALVILGAKRYETRSWRTSYRGPLVIHAAKKMTESDRDLCLKTPFATALGVPQDTKAWIPDGSLVLGAALGVVELLGCYRTEDIPFLDGQALTQADFTETERAFGDYSSGRWAWELKLLRRFAKPIPCRGSLGLWDFNEAVISEAEG